MDDQDVCQGGERSLDGQRTSQVEITKRINTDLNICTCTVIPCALLPSFRYLLPALCHLSAEDGPRKVLLTHDTPALLVDFLSQTWICLKGKSGVASARDPSMETVCSALLNFTVTEPERVR